MFKVCVHRMHRSSDTIGKGFPNTTNTLLQIKTRLTLFELMKLKFQTNFNPQLQNNEYQTNILSRSQSVTAEGDKLEIMPRIVSWLGSFTLYQFNINQLMKNSRVDSKTVFSSSFGHVSDIHFYRLLHNSSDHYNEYKGLLYSE